MLKCLKKIDKAKTGILQQAFCSEPQVSKYCPARMRRSCTQTAPQQFCAQKSVS